MLLLLALALLVAAFASVLALVAAVRPRPLALAAPLALAVFVCFESVALQGLSLVRGVTAVGVAAAELLLVGLVAIGGGPRVRAQLSTMPRRAVRTVLGSGIPGLLLLSILVLLVASASATRPATGTA